MMKIEDLDFSVRTYNCLKRKKIDTVEKLARMTDDQLLSIRGFGALCLKEVHEKLGKIRETDIPVVPGPSVDNPNIMEMCFNNGKQHMKEKVISCLMEHKTRVKGECHEHVVEIIKMVEGL